MFGHDNHCRLSGTGQRTSDRHVRAIADGVLYDIKEMGALPFHRDGTPDAGWIVLDYADTIVHVFHAREREYYDLERMYRGAPVIRTGHLRKVTNEPTLC